MAIQATLTWNANTEADLAGYKVYYSISPITSTVGITFVDVGNVTIHTFQTLVDSRPYFFRVTAYDTSNNESSFSNQVSKFIDPTIKGMQGWTIVI